ncbi:hypothetical protein BJF79_46460 [Actinomadura sp. CNU-125]|uniref:hypothetical protein n=1 Tax=Actinomadura sp. CNU-125 TaxID=1904961 RepID=UPI0009595146|nr:hypothetical protein [Actinomadura sp. CNU-125]OLT22169.1 hypothetical protein BJF79_46460 [Actinomadura sp. CNU-125]
MTRKSKPDLYDLLRINFGNETVEPDKLPEPDRRADRTAETQAASPPRRAAARTGPVTVRRPDPKAWKAAREAVGGDTRRLEVMPDGSVFIHNQPIR